MSITCAKRDLRTPSGFIKIYPTRLQSNIIEATTYRRMTEAPPVTPISLPRQRTEPSPWTMITGACPPMSTFTVSSNWHQPGRLQLFNFMISNGQRGYYEYSASPCFTIRKETLKRLDSCLETSSWCNPSNDQAHGVAQEPKSRRRNLGPGEVCLQQTAPSD